MELRIPAKRALAAWGLAALALALAAPASAVTLNVGHRGYSAAYPEDTLVAIDGAFDVGADMAEIDLQKTADGAVVILHDDTVDRTTTGPWTGPIANLTLSQVGDLEAGSWFAPEFAGEPVPTLEQALLAGLGRGPLLLDQKSGILFGSEIAAAALATGFSTSDLWVTAWSAAQVNDIRSIPALDDVRILYTSQLGLNPSISADFLDNAAALGVDGISLVFENYTLGDPALAAEAHARGLLAYAWNIILFPETVAKMETAVALGLDGYIVNDPETFGAVLPEPGIGLALAGALLVVLRKRGAAHGSQPPRPHRPALGS